MTVLFLKTVLREISTILRTAQRTETRDSSLESIKTMEANVLKVRHRIKETMKKCKTVLDRQVCSKMIF